MNIKVIVEPGKDGYFVAHVPSLKSCWSQGKTKEKALENIREAIDLYLEPEANELADDQELVELTVRNSQYSQLSKSSQPSNGNSFWT